MVVNKREDLPPIEGLKIQMLLFKVKLEKSVENDLMTSTLFLVFYIQCFPFDPTTQHNIKLICLLIWRSAEEVLVITENLIF